MKSSEDSLADLRKREPDCAAQAEDFGDITLTIRHDGSPTWSAPAHVRSFEDAAILARSYVKMKLARYDDLVSFLDAWIAARNP